MKTMINDLIKMRTCCNNNKKWGGAYSGSAFSLIQTKADYS